MQPAARIINHKMKKLIFLALLLTDISACQLQSSEGQTGASASYRDISVAEFKNRMDDEAVVLLDVRTPPEIAEGKIAGAKELDFRSPDFSEKVGTLDKEKTYLIYCRSGGRSGNTCKMMADKGFKKLYNLKGGYNAWLKEN